MNHDQPSQESTLIRRHKNPVGIFARVFIYPLMAVGVWQHNVYYVLAGVILEVLNWTVVPPVEKTLPFIQHVIDRELEWLRAPPGTAKLLSILLFGMFLLLLSTGLWLHSPTLLMVSLVVIVIFRFLMNYVAMSGHRMP